MAKDFLDAYNFILDNEQLGKERIERKEQKEKDRLQLEEELKL